MKLKVTQKGVLIPKRLLGESQEVELTQEQDKIIITIIKKSSSIGDLDTESVEHDVKNNAINYGTYEKDKYHINELSDNKLSKLLLLPELEENESLFKRDKQIFRNIIL